MSAPSIDTSFHKTVIRQEDRTKPFQDDEPQDKYWKKFKTPVVIKEIGAVTHINFSPTKPHYCAVSTSTRVQIYNPTTNQVKRTISRFNDVVYSASFRNDGKLLITGGEEGLVKVLDFGSRAILRTFKGHTGAVRVTKFSPHMTQAVSGSNDKTVRHWDLVTESELAVLKGHEDYIRCASVTPATPDTWVTGSYDHTVKIWDMRTHECVNTIDHGDPVEDVIMFPGGSIIVSAGGNQLKVWDLLAGGRLLTTISNHQKTITSIALDGEGSRLFSGGIDHHLKIYDIKNYSVVQSYTYPAPILSIGVSPDNSRIMVGMTDSTLSIRNRVVKMAEVMHQEEKKKQYAGGNYRYFIRGKNAQASKEDYQVEVFKKKQLKEYDAFLKKFQYKDALDAAIKTNNPVIISSILEELIRRDGLTIALSGRNEETLQPLLQFLTSNITDRRHASLIIDVTNLLLDLYSTILGHSVVIDDMLFVLKERVAKELQFQQELFQMMGSLDLIFAASSLSTNSQIEQQ